MKWIEIKKGEEIPDKFLLAYSPQFGYSLGSFRKNLNTEEDDDEYHFYNDDMTLIQYVIFTHYCLLVPPQQQELEG